MVKARDWSKRGGTSCAAKNTKYEIAFPETALRVIELFLVPRLKVRSRVEPFSLCHT